MVVASSEQNPYVLHIEDNDGDAYLVVRALRNCGRDVRIGRSADGSEAQMMLDEIAGHKHERPDLILLDLKLPIISGFELLDHIRAHPSLVDIPVVIFTSSDEQKDIDEGSRRGCTAYYVKPIDFNVFRETIVEICEKFLPALVGANTPDPKNVFVL